MSLKNWHCLRLWRRDEYAPNGWRYPDIAYLDEHDKPLVLERMCSKPKAKARGAGYYYDDPRGVGKLVGPFKTVRECVKAAETATEKPKK